MNLIKPSYEILGMFPAEADCLQWLERIARICYKSEDKITAESAPRFIRQLFKLDRMDKLRDRFLDILHADNNDIFVADELIQCVRGMLADPPHESVAEHSMLTVLFVFDRGISHEIVRHRLCAFTQESTRFCNYGKTGFVNIIEPSFFVRDDEAYKRKLWESAMVFAEQIYVDLIAAGATPQEARSVLPTATKTEIVVTANFRQWRHIFFLRAAKNAHPQMREVIRPLLQDIQSMPNLGLLFRDINV